MALSQNEVFDSLAVRGTKFLAVIGLTSRQPRQIGIFEIFIIFYSFILHDEKKQKYNYFEFSATMV